jgi:hypothetical protein
MLSLTTALSANTGYSQSTSACILSDLHTLSIHVRDTVTHDSVFHFLTDLLKLPVYYDPVKFGIRKYAGIYAGNLVLEPCGPYQNYTYAGNDFKAIFFGLTFQPCRSLTDSQEKIAASGYGYQPMGEVYLNFNDSRLCGDMMTIGIMDKPDKPSDEIKRDSLRQILLNDGGDNPGIEFVKEISIGYTDSVNLYHLRNLIYPGEPPGFPDNDYPKFTFIKSNLKEIKSITIKVKTLIKAREYLSDAGIAFIVTGDDIEIRRDQVFGLSILFTESE